MKSSFKILMLLFIRFSLKLLYIFPIKKNRIMFIAYNGRQYTCNPKYFFEYLKETTLDFQSVWVLEKSVNLPKILKSSIITHPYTLKYLYYAMTSNVIITNENVTSYIPVRKKQKIINTWHGGGVYKTSGLGGNIKPSKYELFSLNIMSKNLTWFLSSSESFSRNMSKYYLIPKDKMLNIGMPRNDFLFSNKKCEESKKQFKKELSINSNFSIVVYTPTFRGLEGNKEIIEIDVEPLLRILEKKFNNPFVFIFRGHHASTFNEKTSFQFDLSGYPDGQKIISAADVLISDYSSILWDFSMTKKPCFVYAQDSDYYKDIDRGFSSDINSWPYPLARDNEELHKNILSYKSDVYKIKVNNHHFELNNFEQGNSNHKLYDYIKSYLE